MHPSRITAALSNHPALRTPTLPPQTDVTHPGQPGAFAPPRWQLQSTARLVLLQPFHVDAAITDPGDTSQLLKPFAHGRVPAEPGRRASNQEIKHNLHARLKEDNSGKAINDIFSQP